MTTFKITRAHQLDPEQTKTVVDRMAKKLEQDLDARCEWQGSTLKFSRPGAKGEVRMEPSCVDIEVTLGVLLRPLQGRIQQTIENEIDKYLES